MKNAIFVLSLLFAGLSITAHSDELNSATLSNAEQDQMTVEAKKLIDDWGGSGNGMLQASALLDKVLQANPKNMEAHFERARYFISSGHINFRNFQPGALENASQELQLALQQNPNWGQAYVLLGHIQYLSGDSKKAIELLKKAEALGTDYKWLYINWGSVLTDLNDWRGAEIQLNKARARKDLSNQELSGLYEALINSYGRQGKIAEANQVYKDNLALNPNSAWSHGNYAEFLLLRRGLPDEAVAEANNALQIMDYGAGHVILGTAQYAKWAQLKEKNRTVAEEYLRHAQENAPSMAWVFPRVGMSVDAGPALQNLVKALIRTGVSIDTTDDNGDTAFTLAAASGNLKAMKWIAEHGANINFTLNGVPSALEYAINMQDQRTIDALIALKADVNQKNAYGMTPLMVAASQGSDQTAKKLVASGADWKVAAGTPARRAEDFAVDAGHKALASYLHDLDKNGKREK